MSIPQRHEIRDRVSEDSEKDSCWSTTIGLASRSDRSDTMHDDFLSTRSTFLEDFTVEHSDDGMRTEVIELAGIF
jgi:hypothetical protein